MLGQGTLPQLAWLHWMLLVYILCFVLLCLISLTVGGGLCLARIGKGVFRRRIFQLGDLLRKTAGQDLILWLLINNSINDYLIGIFSLPLFLLELLMDNTILLRFIIQHFLLMIWACFDRTILFFSLMWPTADSILIRSQSLSAHTRLIWLIWVHVGPLNELLSRWHLTLVAKIHTLVELVIYLLVVRHSLELVGILTLVSLQSTKLQIFFQLFTLVLYKHALLMTVISILLVSEFEGTCLIGKLSWLDITA